MATHIIRNARIQIADEDGEFRDICDLENKEIKLELGELEFTGRLEMDLASRIRLRVWMMTMEAVTIARRILG